MLKNIKKIMGTITLVLSLLIIISSSTNFTGFSILSNSQFYSSNASLIGVLFLVVSLVLLSSRESSMPLEERVEEIDFVETAKGSRYNYLPDGRTQRLRAVEGTKYEPQDALVFIPDWSTVKKTAPKELLESGILGENEIQYEQQILSYSQGSEGKKRVILVNRGGTVIRTNEQIANEKGNIFLAFQDKKRDKIDFMIPISRTPHIGYYTFDTRTYEEGEEKLTERHIGNLVVRIGYKDGKVVS